MFLKKHKKGEAEAWRKITVARQERSLLLFLVETKLAQLFRQGPFSTYEPDTYFLHISNHLQPI